MSNQKPAGIPNLDWNSRGILRAPHCKRGHDHHRQYEDITRRETKQCMPRWSTANSRAYRQACPQCLPVLKVLKRFWRTSKSHHTQVTATKSQSFKMFQVPSPKTRSRVANYQMSDTQKWRDVKSLDQEPISGTFLFLWNKDMTDFGWLMAIFFASTCWKKKRLRLMAALR